MNQYMGIKDLYDILFNRKELVVTDDIREKVESGYRFLENFSKDKVVYGINTGFGPMAQYRVDDPFFYFVNK